MVDESTIKNLYIKLIITDFLLCVIVVVLILFIYLRCCYYESKHSQNGFYSDITTIYDKKVKFMIIKLEGIKLSILKCIYTNNGEI